MFLRVYNYLSRFAFNLGGLAVKQAVLPCRRPSCCEQRLVKAIAGVIALAMTQLARQVTPWARRDGMHWNAAWPLPCRARAGPARSVRARRPASGVGAALLRHERQDSVRRPRQVLMLLDP